MSPERFNSECPKCGEGIYSLSKFSYCWRHLQQKCPIWKTYGGEHLHRTCTCGYIYAILPKDQSDELAEGESQAWLDRKVDETLDITEDSVLILPEDIDWEPPSEDFHKRSDIG